METQTQTTAYRCLYLAVIYRAALDLSKGGEKKRKALNWIKSKNNLDHIQSFTWYCEALRICPIRTRKKILELY